MASKLQVPATSTVVQAMDMDTNTEQCTQKQAESDDKTADTNEPGKSSIMQ